MMAQTLTPKIASTLGNRSQAQAETTTVKKTTVKKTMVKKSPVKRRSLGRTPATFDYALLEASFVHFCQLAVPELETADERSRHAKNLLTTEIECIDSTRLTSQESVQEIFSDGYLIPNEVQLTGRSKALEMPSHLARLCEAKLLTPEEERMVFQRMNCLRSRANQLRGELTLDAPCGWTIRRIVALLKAADWYRDRMIKSNMRLVISIVKKFVNKQNSFDDLLSDGIVALLRAVDKFDVGLGFRFSTYATQVVRRNTYRRVMEKQSERQRITLSIHDAGVDISDEHRSPSMSESRWHELRSRLSTMLDRLDRREKLIVRARFSLGGHRRVQTLQRLADKLGVSKERVRQLEKRALDKLRDLALEARLPDNEV